MSGLRPVARAVAGALLGWSAAGAAGALVGAVAALLSVPWWARRRAAALRAALPDEVADLVELAARASRSGLSLPQALADAAQSVGGPAGELVDELLTAARSAPLGTACRTWAAVHPDPAVALVGAAIGVAASGSGSGARALDAAARTLRDRRASQSEVHAWSTQARASAVLLALTPLGFATLTVVARPGAVATVLAEPAAAASVALGLLADALGGWWMLRLVARAQELV
jgi:tight adherence protein B